MLKLVFKLEPSNFCDTHYCVITLTFFNNTNLKGIKSVKSCQLAHEDFMWVGLEHTPQSYNFLRQQQIIQYIFTSIEEYFELVVIR